MSLCYGGISLSNIERDGNKWTRTILYDQKPACIVSGVGKGFHVTVRWKQYSMIAWALNRITETINRLDPETGEVIGDEPLP